MGKERNKVWALLYSFREWVSIQQIGFLARFPVNTTRLVHTSALKNWVAGTFYAGKKRGLVLQSASICEGEPWTPVKLGFVSASLSRLVKLCLFADFHLGKKKVNQSRLSKLRPVFIKERIRKALDVSGKEISAIGFNYKCCLCNKWRELGKVFTIHIQ